MDATDHTTERYTIQSYWNDFFTHIVDPIEDDGYEPNTIAWIPAGGSRLGSDLKYYFDDKRGTDTPYGIIPAKHYDGKQQRDEVHVDEEGAHISDLTGDILLVDEISDTGKTLTAVERYLKKADAANEININTIRTATLHSKNETVTPDYVARTVPQDVWIEYDWKNLTERRDDLTTPTHKQSAQ